MGPGIFGINSLCVIAQDSKAEIFDVFLCHNSEDKSAVREIAQWLSEENIKAWLDEADIRSGSFWHAAIGQQIETVKSAAVCVGQHGVGPWQHREIIALLDQFDRRGCPVIPVIPFETEEEAIRLANDSWAGLAGSVWTADSKTANRVGGGCSGPAASRPSC